MQMHTQFGLYQFNQCLAWKLIMFDVTFRLQHQKPWKKCRENGAVFHSHSLGVCMWMCARVCVCVVMPEKKIAFGNGFAANEIKHLNFFSHKIKSIKSANRRNSNNCFSLLLLLLLPFDESAQRTEKKSACKKWCFNFRFYSLLKLL